MRTEKLEPVVQIITGGASADEVAAIVAAVNALVATQMELSSVSEPPSTWVVASRLRARRGRLERGSWRLSGQLGRQARR
ncbi:MAG: hypothetical protein EXQ69_01190 [Acidimicrobiia bacterium]|nr:hypothetical protein [Acidimicrobiia bacterium]